MSCNNWSMEKKAKYGDGGTNTVFYCVLRWFFEQEITTYMAYVCMFLALLIVAISLLTKKKEAYHINILNQVFFDIIFLIYQKACYHSRIKVNQRGTTIKYVYSSTCQNHKMTQFFGAGDALQSLQRTFNDFQAYLHCFTSFSLVLFSSVRFAAIFFPIWYNRVFSLKKHIFIIVFANFLYALFIVLISFVSIFWNVSCKEYLHSYYLIDYYFQNNSTNDFKSIFKKFGLFHFIQSSIDPILSLLSILPVIFSILILIKLVPHFLKNKSNQNRKQMLSNLRISLTLLFQSLFLLAYALFILYRDTYLFFTLINAYYYILNTLFYTDYAAYDELTHTYSHLEGYVDYILPGFLDPLYDLANLNGEYNDLDIYNNYVLVHSFLIIRIFLDYTTIFFVMPTYREAWTGLCKKVYRKIFVRNNVKEIVSNNHVFIMSQSTRTTAN